MSRVSRDSIEEVRRAVDIVDLISAVVPLKKRGAGYWACCPFHDEKTPSFQVSPSRQVYKCFGCGVFGNSISFLMEHEKLDFREAVEKLASRAGIELRYEGGGPSAAERSLRTRALDIMAWAQRGFAGCLQRLPQAQQYVESRGLGGEIAERWGLGFAPDEWDRVGQAARARFKDDEALEATGLCRRNDAGRWYDFFRGRLTFPIRDAQGRIVGFGARLLDPDAKAQKYVNSAEGLLFHKSRLLYAIDRLAESKRLKETGRALIMEGYTDVILSHECGFDNAVAPLGTALTRDQLHLLRRYSKGVVLVLDGDEAGIRGAERSLNVVLEAGVDAQVAVLPDGMDPYDLLRAKGPAAMQEALDKARDAFDFKLSMLAQRHDLARPVEAEAALGELAELLGRAESASLRELYAKRAAAALNLREPVVVAAVERAHRQFAQTEERARRSEDVRVAAAPAAGDKAQAPQTVAAASYERELLGRLLQHQGVLRGAGELLDPACFSRPGLQELYREMLNAVDEHGEAAAGALVTHLGEAGRSELEAVLAHLEVPVDQSAGDAEREEARLRLELERFAAARGEQEAPADSRAKLALLRKKKARPGREG
ncbi:MAG: DNA primase [Planctomycetes bacterium]|nr:DNA primase [Planctomycetota bacterium]